MLRRRLLARGAVCANAPYKKTVEGRPSALLLKWITLREAIIECVERDHHTLRGHLAIMRLGADAIRRHLQPRSG